MQKERINNRKQKQQKIKGFLYVKKSCDSCNNNNDDDIDVDDKIYKIEMKKNKIHKTNNKLLSFLCITK